MSHDLRDYQQAAIDATWDALGSQAAALLVLPTGTGKTVVFTEFIRQYGEPTLVLAHRQELLTQARDKLMRGWPEADIGLIGAGYNEPGHLITIGSVQSLSQKKRLAWLAEQRIQLVIVDEAHHATAATYQKILDAIPAGKTSGHEHSAFLLGVTATPKRSDKKSILPIFGDPVFSAGLAEMIHKGYLSPIRGITIRTTTSLDAVPTRGGDFAEGALGEVVNRDGRNRVIVEAYQEHAAGRQSIAFTAGVKHAHDLAAYFQSIGVPAEALDGATAQDDRERILNAYADGSLRIICNCGVLTEGFDAPKTSCIILARPTESQGLYLQMIGRGTRLADGKEDCLILDIADLCTKHTLVMLPDVYQPLKPALVTSESVGGGDRDQDDNLLPPNGRIVANEIVLLPGPWTWLSDRTAYWRTPGIRGEMRIKATVVDGRGTWRPFYAPNGGLSAEYALIPSADLSLTAEAAMAFCEHKARKINEGFYAPGAPWRKSPATIKQLDTLRNLRHVCAQGMTKGNASDWIDWLMFLRQQRRRSA